RFHLVAYLLQRRVDVDAQRDLFGAIDMQRRLEADPRMGEIGEPAWRRQQRYLPTAFGDEGADGLISVSLAVEIMIGMYEIALGAPVRGEGHVAFDHQADARVVGLDSRDNNAVGGAGVENVADR